MGAIYKRELKSYFVSPLGYIFMANFLAISGLIFSICTLQKQEKSSVSAYFLYLLIAFAILLPLLTMKSLSEERKTKTEQLLMTAPISISGMIFGKYFAALTVFAGTLAINSLNFILLGIYGNPNVPLIAANVLCLFFVGALFLAIGIFFSSLTEDALISALTSMDVIFALFAFSFFARGIEIKWLKTLIQWFSILDRHTPFMNGQLDITSIIYFVSFAGVFLFLAVRVYERRRWA